MDLSSCEVEYIISSLCTCQVIWLLNLIDKVEGNVHGVMTMKIDNISSINLRKNHVVHGRSKHIEMMFHYFRKQVSNRNRRLCLQQCTSEDQVTDIINKAVQVELFQKFRSMMG